MRNYVCTGVALVLMLAIAGCGAGTGTGSSNVADGGAGSSKPYAELRWGMTPFPGALDFTRVPYGTTGAAESLAVQNLMEFEPDGNVKPGLASSVEQPNPTTYVYHLRPVKFSDGKPLTAADVVYSLDRNITGKEAWAKSYWEDVASIAARDRSTVVVKLKRPVALFQDIVAFSGLVIEKTAAERDGEKALGSPGHMPIGTGPWKLDSYKPESSVRLSRNPYWTGPPLPADRVSIEFFKTEAGMALALRSGAIDGADTYVSPKIFANIPSVRQLAAPGEQVVLAEANTRRPPFNDVHVRRALAYATDAKGMVDALYSGTYATENSFYVPNSLLTKLGSESEVNQALATVPKFEFNLAKAKQELAKSTYPHGFSMPIEVAQGVEAQISAAQILASDLAKIGIKATVHEITHAEETRLLTGKAILDITDSSANYPDPESILEERLSPQQIYPQGGGVNVANYRNNEFDKLLTETPETLNRPRRLEMIGKLLGIVRSEVPNWPLYSPKNLAALANKFVLPGFSFWTIYYTPWALRVKLAS